MTKLITAWEARNIATSIVESTSLLLDGFNLLVGMASREGKVDVNFYTGGEHFSESELQYIRDLGYSISWNSSCLWYEISWEK